MTHMLVIRTRGFPNQKVYTTSFSEEPILIVHTVLSGSAVLSSTLDVEFPETRMDGKVPRRPQFHGLHTDARAPWSSAFSKPSPTPTPRRCPRLSRSSPS